MSPENDQCRWIGIRPTNPPEDIPVTLDGEVAHVIVDSGGGGLAPGMPLLIQFYVNSNINVWYTLAEVDPGAGHIQKIHIGAGVFFNNVEYRITIDGAAPVTYAPNATEEKLYQDLSQANRYNKEIPIYLIRYETSFKVEARQTSIAWRDLYGLVSYLPDP